MGPPFYTETASCLVCLHRFAGDEVCNDILSRGGPAPTDWSRLLEPLPFFELFKHYLQVGRGGREHWRGRQWG